MSRVGSVVGSEHTSHQSLTFSTPGDPKCPLLLQSLYRGEKQIQEGSGNVSGSIQGDRSETEVKSPSHEGSTKIGSQVLHSPLKGAGAKREDGHPPVPPAPRSLNSSKADMYREVNTWCQY